MSWWDDFKATRDYYKKLDEHRERADELRDGLKRIDDTVTNHQDRDRLKIDYRNAEATAFSNARPRPPAKMSALARWFSRKSVPTKEQEAELNSTENLFMNDAISVANREVERIYVDKREAAINKGGQVVQQIARDAVPKVERTWKLMQEVAAVHKKAMETAIPPDPNKTTKRDDGTIVPAQSQLAHATIGRLATSMVVMPASQSPRDVAASERENVARMKTADVLSRQINLRNIGSPDFNQEVFDKSVKAVAGYLKPDIQKVKEFDLTQINTNSANWLTEDNLRAMHLASVHFMPLSDLNKRSKEGKLPCPELLDALGINNPEFSVRSRMMDASLRLMRGRVAHDLGDSATKEDYQKLISPNTQTENILMGSQFNPNPTMESIAKGFAELTTGKNNDTYELAGFEGATNYQGMVEAVNRGLPKLGKPPLNLEVLNPPKTLQTSVKMDSKQLGELTGSAPKPRETQAAPKQPQKEAMQNQNTVTRPAPRR